MWKVLAALVLFLCGWFARDLVKVAWCGPTRTVQVQLPAVSVQAPQQAPKAAQPVQKAQAPRTSATPARTNDRSNTALGRSVANNGLWRVHPVSRFDEQNPGDGWGSWLHGEPAY